jgi:hypothetical protein
MFSSYFGGYPAIQARRCLDQFHQKPNLDALGAARVFQVCSLLASRPHGLEMQRKVCIWLQELFSSYSVGYPAIQVFRCLDTFQRSPDRDVLGAARVFQVCRLLDLIPHGLEMQRKGNIWLQEHNCRPPGPLRRVINSPRGGRCTGGVWIIFSAVMPVPLYCSCYPGL